MIRQAVPFDFPHIVTLYKDALIELGETDIKEEYLYKKIVDSFYLAPCILLVINDKICGMVGLSIQTTSHNGVASLTDYMIYVKEEHRSPANLKALIEEAKRFAKDSNMPLLLDYIVQEDTPLKERMLKKYGFSICHITGVYNNG
jgi:hypothetical protein